MKPTIHYVYKAITIAITIAAWGCASRWSDTALTSTKSNGDRIIAAVNAFRQANGEFPRTLEQLRAMELPDEIPLPEVGDKKWEYYITRGGSTFFLGVTDDEKHSQNTLGYDSANKAWVFLQE